MDSEMDMDIPDSDSEMDEDFEEEWEELNRLNAVLEVHAPHASVAVTNATEKPQPEICPITQKLEQIDSAIAQNKLMDEKLRRLEYILTQRLSQCHKQLKTIAISTTGQDKQESFRYFYCGKPYFKDKYNFPAPDNEDTTLMAATQMYDFSQVGSVPGWTVRDKSQFMSEITKMSQAVRKRELHAKIAQLRRGKKGDEDKKVQKLIKDLSREICKLDQKPLSEIALPLEQNYDWDTLANKLNRRHTAQEYEALWRLFFHPSINKNSWTKAEHNDLQRIATDNNLQDWDDIANKLGTGRTGYQCFVYFRTNMTNLSSGRRWSIEEVEFLRRLVDYYREDNYIPWGKVAASMENRTKIQIYNKYLRLIGHRKGRFLAEEDTVILNCAAKYGANYKKMMSFLPGRSIIQVRNRYHVLCKMRVSMVWTEAEDRKLLQLMAQDNDVTFSSLSEYFPGKDRVHIRSRYLTLVKWMRRNPNSDIAHAPRRGARRLTHGKATQNLNKAIEDLKTRMETEVQIKKCSKLTKDSPETHIDDAIIATLYNEHIREMEKKQCDEADKKLNVAESFSTDSHNVTNLRNVLLFLNANLNKGMYARSHYCETYPGLDETQEVSTSKMKSYSKKNQVVQIETINKNTGPDIWGNRLGNVKNVLPPHYATITGCRALMAFTTCRNTRSEAGISTQVLLKRNSTLRHQMNLLMERFQILFTWPMLLSNEGPDVATILDNTKRKAAARSRPDIPTPASSSELVSSIPAVYVPVKQRGTKLDKEKYKSFQDIDLDKEADTENVNIDEEDLIDLHEAKPSY